MRAHRTVRRPAVVTSVITRRRPHRRYKIAIFEISASESVVRSRIAERAAATGRDVPEHLIKASLASVTTSLDVLTPLCDFVARIGNEHSAPMPPVLRAFIQVDKTGDWGRIEERFAKPEEESSFPRSLAPLKLVQAPPGLVIPTSNQRGDEAIELQFNQGGLGRIKDAFHDGHRQLKISPPQPVALKGAAKALAGIPDGAHQYSFCYPASLDWNRARKPSSYSSVHFADAIRVGSLPATCTPSPSCAGQDHR